MTVFLRFLPWVLAALLAIGIAILGYQHSELDKKRVALETDTASLQDNISHLQEQLHEAHEQASSLSSALDSERKRNNDLNDEVDDISGTVSVLQRLAETDPELLIKYSKVYFLNENYIPSGLSEISEEYVYPKGTTESIHDEVWPQLKRMLEDATDDGLDLKVISGYRSFDQQASLKAAYRVTYGTGANKFSADQGYSEHQLGTTVDFTTEKVGSTFAGFEKTEEFAWLQENAYKYGFILSYPANNSYYQYEPWHWRFVGKDLADTLHDEGKSFYDLDQRTIDQYLADIFE